MEIVLKFDDLKTFLAGKWPEHHITKKSCIFRKKIIPTVLWGLTQRPRKHFDRHFWLLLFLRKGFSYKPMLVVYKSRPFRGWKKYSMCSTMNQNWYFHSEIAGETSDEFYFLLYRLLIWLQKSLCLEMLNWHSNNCNFIEIAITFVIFNCALFNLLIGLCYLEKP